MSNAFFVIVDERDRDRFRSFKLQEKIKNNKSILWGLASKPDSDLWNNISKNDIVYFSHKNSPFTIFGIVLKKEVNRKLSEQLWGSSPRIKSIDHFIFFSILKSTSIPFHELINFSKKKISIDIFPGIYEIKNEFNIKHKQIVLSSKVKNIQLKPVTIPVDFAGAPKTKNEKVIRFIRDTKKTRLLKKKYQHKCQVCNYLIPIGSDKFYSEVHHLYPLKDGGDDNFNNMVVLCPTHHAEFDYKVIGIDIDGCTIINKDGLNVGTLTLAKDHKINLKNILFHLEGLKSK